jgi:hypothetical protein
MNLHLTNLSTNGPGELMDVTPPFMKILSKILRFPAESVFQRTPLADIVRREKQLPTSTRQVGGWLVCVRGSLLVCRPGCFLSSNDRVLEERRAAPRRCRLSAGQLFGFCFRVCC